MYVCVLREPLTRVRTLERSFVLVRHGARLVVATSVPRCERTLLELQKKKKKGDWVGDLSIYLYVCMCVCIYIHIHIHICIYMYMYMW